MSGTHNFTIEQGTTWHRRITWLIDDDPVDLTAYSARLQVRSHVRAGTTILSLTSAVGGGLTLGGVAGTIDVDLTATATAALTPGLYVYDLELVDGSGTVTRLLEGTVQVTAEVTR